ncbi:MAG: Mth938-like domain-containing protein [Candidatus Bathyarchaeia archaeon]
MIDSYDFGVIVVNGKRYTSDVIIFPERVLTVGGEGKDTKFV